MMSSALQTLTTGDARPNRLVVAAMLLALTGVVACSEGPAAPRGDGPIGDGFVDCNINIGFLISGAPFDAIRSVDEPVWVRAEDGVPSYLEPDDRVIGLILNGQPHAVPLNVMWFHEVVNAGAGAFATAVTHCPLTGSSLAFSRAGADEGALGVSGLLFMSNLVMFDRGDPESRWSQMAAGAICGPDAGSSLDQVPVFEMRWAEWLELHPSTFVLDGDQGFDDLRGLFDTDSPYFAINNPYGGYDEVDGFFALGAMPPIDPRRPPKERVIGIPPSDGDPGIAFPFGALTGSVNGFEAIRFTYGGRPSVLLWSDEAEGGMAFRLETAAGQDVSLVPTGAGFRDEGTGSIWTVDGRAVSGAMQGARLVALERAFVSFWGAWAAFHPGAQLWEG